MQTTTAIIITSVVVVAIVGVGFYVLSSHSKIEGSTQGQSMNDPVGESRSDVTPTDTVVTNDIAIPAPTPGVSTKHDGANPEAHKVTAPIEKQRASDTETAVPVQPAGVAASRALTDLEILEPTSPLHVVPGSGVNFIVRALGYDTVVLAGLGDVVNCSPAQNDTYTCAYKVPASAVGTLEIAVVARKTKEPVRASEFAFASTTLVVDNGSIVRLEVRNMSGDDELWVMPPDMGPTNIGISAVHADGNKEYIREGLTFKGYDSSLISIEYNDDSYSITPKKNAGSTQVTFSYKGVSATISVQIME